MSIQIFGNKLKTKRKQTSSAIALILLLIMVVSAIPSLPAAFGQWFDFPRQTWAHMSIAPNPVGVNQQTLISAWISPRPLEVRDTYEGYMFTFTKPDGTIDKVGPMGSETTGSTWFNYAPDQVGTWTVEFSWPGNANNTGSATEKQQLIVQKDPLTSWPPAPLPNDPLTFPVNPENREWFTIAGNWLRQEYDYSHSASNPYSQAPASAHVLWKIPPIDGSAGLIGGKYGTKEYYYGLYPNIYTVIAGKAYYVDSVALKIRCVDIRTGKELFTMNSASGHTVLGVIESTPPAAGQESMGSRNTASIFCIGTRLIKYDAFSGRLLLNVTGFAAPTFMVGTTAYNVQTLGKNKYLVSWNTTGTESNFTKRITYNVTLPMIGDGIVWSAAGDVAGGTSSDTGDDSFCVDLKTGKMLWNKNITNIECDMATGQGYGKVFVPIVGGKMIAIDVKTGNTAWESEEMPYPWGEFWAYTQCIYNGNVIANTYAGMVSLNAETGKTNWFYSTGDSNPTGETPYGTWPLYNGPLAADGKIYTATTEHSPSQPYYRGQLLHCVDANTGQRIWTMMGIWNPTAIAGGNLFATNVYDGNSYSFGKGETATTVSASPTVLTKGSSVLITGSITDQSPAQPGTPAVSDGSMSQWMEYLHLQQPKPTNAAGVEVRLTAIDSNGNSQDISVVTSDMSGSYSTMWTPTLEGKYTIVASFEGTNSYFTSDAQTSIGVSNALVNPTPTPETTKTVNQVSAEGFYAFAAAIIVLILVVAVLFYRKK